MIKEYKVLVIKTTELTILLNEEKFNKDFLQEYSQYFSQADNLDDLIETIGYQVGNGEGNFIEGIGAMKRWDQTTEEHFKLQGFSVREDYEDTEVQIESISTRTA